MIFNLAGCGQALNFKVVGSFSQPESPSENTIWVKTGTTISTWLICERTSMPSFSATTGQVVIDADTVDSVTSGTATLNVVKGSSGNAVRLKLNKAYLCSGGSSWAAVSAYIYKNGSWIQFSSTYTESIPTFTYSGDYEIVNDSDSAISTTEGNWKIRFLTSGTLKFTALNGAANGIDVFCVGGGESGHYTWKYGGGGGGGYTTTKKGVMVTAGTSYTINIGAGGASQAANGSYSTGGNEGGTTSAFNVTAKGGTKCEVATGYLGGYAGYQIPGGDGGSGGGGGRKEGGDDGKYAESGAGGTDGGNGGGTCFGRGQGTTTREFGEANGRLYATGGDGSGLGTTPATKAANTGDGGDGGHENTASGAGSSGIVIIRNKR